MQTLFYRRFFFFSSREKSLPKYQGAEQKPNGWELKINKDESCQGKELSLFRVRQSSVPCTPQGEEETAVEYQYCNKMQRAIERC